MDDYGCDPLGDGMFKLVPSGRIVNKEERDRVMSKRKQYVRNDCLGLSWEQIEKMQGGKLNRKF